MSRKWLIDVKTSSLVWEVLGCDLSNLNRCWCYGILLLWNVYVTLYTCLSYQISTQRQQVIFIQVSLVHKTISGKQGRY